MSTVEEIENAVKDLTPEQYEAFRKWFETYESELWDSQIERDAKKGKLEVFAREAVEEFDSGKCSEL